MSHDAMGRALDLIDGKSAKASPFNSSINPSTPSDHAFRYQYLSLHFALHDPEREVVSQVQKMGIRNRGNPG
jgi:hypothetical protein